MQKVAELEQIRDAISQTIFVVLLSMLAPLNDDAMWWAMNILSGNFPRKAAAAAGSRVTRISFGDDRQDMRPTLRLQSTIFFWKSEKYMKRKRETYVKFWNFAQFCTDCTIKHTLHNFALFAHAAKLCPFCTNLQIFAIFLQHCTFCRTLHILYIFFLHFLHILHQ